MLKSVTTTFSEDEITALIENAVNKAWGCVTQKPSAEIICRDELCKRLNITEPTVIRYEKKKKIPSFRIGSAVRYNWPQVVKALEK